MYHFNALGDRHRGHAPLRRAWRHLPPVLRVAVLARDEPGRGHRHLDPRDDGLPAGPRRRPARDAGLGRARGQPHLAPDGRRPSPTRGGRHSPVALRNRDFQRRLRRHRGQLDLLAAARTWRTGPMPPGVVNDEFFDVRIFDDDDHELAARKRGRDRDPAEAAARDVRGLLGKAGGHRRDDAQPLVPHRRHRADRRGPLPLLRRPQGGLPAPPGREHRQLRGGIDPDGPRRAGRRRGPRRPQPLDGGRPQDHRHGQGGCEPQRGGSLPLVRRPAPLLLPAALHRVPRRPAAQPGRARLEARAARGGGHAGHLGRRGGGDRVREDDEGGGRPRSGVSRIIRAIGPAAGRKEVP